MRRSGREDKVRDVRGRDGEREGWKSVKRKRGKGGGGERE